MVYPGHHDLPDVPRGALDDEWLPVVGTKGLVVITRVRGFVLTGKRSQTTADSLAILDRHWSSIEAAVAEGPDGPWMQSVTERAVRPILLT